MKGQLVGPFSFGGMKLSMEGMLCVLYNSLLNILLENITNTDMYFYSDGAILNSVFTAKVFSWYSTFTYL